MNLDGSGRERLTQLDAQWMRPEVSPDGSMIAFAADLGGGQEIYVVGSDGSNPTRVATVTYGSDQPFWSEDGERVYYVSNVSNGGDSHIYSVRTDGSDERLDLALDFNIGSPELSPDGQRVAFQQRMDEDGHTDMFTIRLDGSALTRVTTRESWSYHPSWSPDGSRIAFASGVIWVVNADGSGLTNLHTGGRSAWIPAWSPDGQWIAFERRESDDAHRIYLVRPDGSDLTRVSPESETLDLVPIWVP